MATQSPFLFLQDLPPLPHLSPPAWALDEVRHRIVLLLNHVLLQESEARLRLAKQKGRVVLVQWRSLSMKVMATPAGLLDQADEQAKPDLLLTIAEESPFTLAQAVLSGNKPVVRIEGDVQLAAEVNWLVDHVRWELEEDLSRVIGDVPAHTLAQAARNAVVVLRQFVGKVAATPSSKAQP